MSVAASVAAVPSIAAAAVPDPIFGCIEALKTAEARLDEIRDMSDQPTYEAACRAADEAFDDLTETPTTLPGMIALLEFLDEWCGGNAGSYFDYRLLLSAACKLSEPSSERRRRPFGCPFLFGLR